MNGLDTVIYDGFDVGDCLKALTIMSLVGVDVEIPFCKFVARLNDLALPPSAACFVSRRSRCRRKSVWPYFWLGVGIVRVLRLPRIAGCCQGFDFLEGMIGGLIEDKVVCGAILKFLAAIAS